MSPMSNQDEGGKVEHTPPPASRGASSSTTMAGTTPTRPNNNYASINTPIASAKRPSNKKRSPIPSSASKQQLSSPPPPSNIAPKTPIRTPPKSTINDYATTSNNNSTATMNKGGRYANLSPMHNVKPVPRDSHHHVPSSKSSNKGSSSAKVSSSSNQVAEGGGDPTSMCCITSTQSSLSIATETVPATTSNANTNTATAAENHPSNSASWVGRKVDALFSPVLSFLNGASGAEEEGGGADETLSSGEIDFCHNDDNDGVKSGEKKKGEDEEEVENMVREALLQAKADLQKEEEYNSRTRTDTFDDIPGMTNTDSSGSNIVDADGDVAMTDCSSAQQRSNGVGGGGEEVTADTVADYLKVTLNGQDDEEEEVEEYYEDDEDDEEEEEFNPYMFIKSLPPYEYAIPHGWKSRPKALPPADPNAHPICLVLDLDETLVHCTVEPVADADMVFPVEFNGMNYQVHVRCRPFLTEFLEAVSKRFEVVIFTASQQVYADKLLDKIDPEGKYIRHRMFRDSCLPVEGNYLKDLTVLGRDLSKAVLVDNSPHAFGYQVDNGIPIESWFDDPRDKELLKLEKFLRTLHGVGDVRDVVRNAFQTHLLVRNA